MLRRPEWTGICFVLHALHRGRECKHDLWPACEGGGGRLRTILSFNFGTLRESNHQWAICSCTTFAILIGALRARRAQCTTGNGATLAFYLNQVASGKDHGRPVGFDCTNKDAVRDNFVHSRAVILWAGDGRDRWFESRNGEGWDAPNDPHHRNRPFLHACMTSRAKT